MHPGLQRAWLQTGGPLVQPIHSVMRQAFDQVDRVEYLGSGCAKLFDQAGNQVGILQFQGVTQAAVDDQVAKELQAAVEGEPGRKPDPAAGDTVIRPLDMNDPTDRELVRLGGAITGVTDRPDLPPVDLPDFDPYDGSTPPTGTPPPMRSDKDYRWSAAVAGTVVALVVFAVLFAMGVL